MIEIVCQKPQSLKQFTDEHCAQASFYFQQLIKDKEIKVNGVKVGADVLLAEGDIVRYYLTAKQESKQAFYIVYEDENFLIVDKESGVNSEAVFAELSRKEGGRVAFIHRLDRNTQGLMAFARNEETEKALLSAFKEKRVEKQYHALCFGRLPKSQDVLSAYLKKDERRALVTIADAPAVGAEKIVTEYRVLENRQECLKAKIILHTGKTHQIRAHFAFIGCPVLGDNKYGNEEANKAYGQKRQLLISKHTQINGTGTYLDGMTFSSSHSFEDFVN